VPADILVVDQRWDPQEKNVAGLLSLLQGDVHKFAVIWRRVASGRLVFACPAD
jgi:hypothetical protein